MKKNLVKENPLMSESKKIKIKRGKDKSEEENTVLGLIITVIIVVAMVVGIYFLIDKFKATDESDANAETAEGTINYEKVTVGTILNRPEEHYYVLVYDSDDDNAITYSLLMDTYDKDPTKEYPKMYFCDLGNPLNSKYYDVNNDNKSNPKAKEIKDFDFGKITLLEINKKKIISYIDNYDDIRAKLK